MSTALCKDTYAHYQPNTTEAIKLEIESIDLKAVLEKCFDWLIDPKVKIAVKVFAIEALFNLRSGYVVINEELANQISFLMNNGSPGIISKGKKLLARIGN